MMYQMAAYCRLSKDDGENKISESIENQMKLIREYAGKSNDLEIADIYIDDGRYLQRENTGCDYERYFPSWT